MSLVRPSRDSLWSQSVSPWLPLWGSCHEVTERVKNALSAPFRGHLSHRERQGPHPSRLRRATFPGGEGFGTHWRSAMPPLTSYDPR